MTTPVAPGGDSQALVYGVNAGVSARQIVKTGIERGGGDAGKFSIQAVKDSFTKGGGIAGMRDATVKNLPLSDALQQQGFIVRWAQKIPFVGSRITQFLGPDAILNNAIGNLGKDAVGTTTKTTITAIALEGGTAKEVAAKLVKAGVTPAAATEIGEAAAQRAAGLAAKAAGAEVATLAGGAAAKSVATNVVDDLAKQAAQLGMKKGFEAAAPEAIKSALKLEGPAALEALKKLGFYAKDAKALVAQAGSTTTKAVATEVTQVAAQTAVKSGGGFLAGLKNFAAKALSGAKGNFVVAGIFSLVTNTIGLATGKLSFTQWAGLTVMDTAAYGAIGWGSAAAGAAIGSVVPGFGTAIGFVAGLAIGVVGGLIYEKFVRNPVKSMLPGPGPSGGTTPGNYDPNAFGPAPADPYNANPARNGNANAPVIPNAGGPISYEDALRQIQQMQRQ